MSISRQNTPELKQSHQRQDSNGNPIPKNSDKANTPELPPMQPQPRPTRMIQKRRQAYEAALITADE